MSPVKPSALAADQRLAEIAEVLAAGLVRLLSRQSTPVSPHFGESALDCIGVQSGPADDLKSEGDSR
jgi:hypothetical protein